MNKACKCDGCGQSPPSYECACRRCASEPDLTERFHCCAHDDCRRLVSFSHERVRGRPAQFVVFSLRDAWDDWSPSETFRTSY